MERIYYKTMWMPVVCDFLKYGIKNTHPSTELPITEDEFGHLRFDEKIGDLKNNLPSVLVKIKTYMA